MPGTREDLSVDVSAFVRRGYELWNDGDLDAVAAQWSDDVVWQNDPDWPGQRTYRGRDNVIRFLREEVADMIDLGDIQVEDVHVFGEELLIRLLARTHGHMSDVNIGKVPIFHVARVRGGQVVRIRAYLDEARAFAAATGESD